MTQGMFFLYAEDDASNRQVMQLLFLKVLSKHQLMLFEDSTDFMERVKALPQRPDVFLLDIQIRPYSGFEMLSMLRADPEYQNTKIIALTASVTNEDVSLLHQRGFDGAISKPLSTATFPGFIEQIAKGETVWYIS